MIDEIFTTIKVLPIFISFIAAVLLMGFILIHVFKYHVRVDDSLEEDPEFRSYIRRRHFPKWVRLPIAMGDTYLFVRKKDVVYLQIKWPEKISISTLDWRTLFMLD